MKPTTELTLHTFKPCRQQGFEILGVHCRISHRAEHFNLEVRPKIVNEGLLIGQETVVSNSSQLCSKYIDSEGPLDGKLHCHGLAPVLHAEQRVCLHVQN